MEARDHRKINSSGHEGHGVHVCHKCGWPFPNPHPSAKHRRAHKRICGTIEGYKLSSSGENKTHLGASDDEHQSDDDSKSPSNGSKTVEKSAGMTISRRGSSGVGSRSSRSTRSDEDVFSDAVTDFVDAPEASDSVEIVREPANVMQDVSDGNRVNKLGVEKAIASDLYPPNSVSGIQQQTVECFKPEIERVEIDMPSQHHLSSSTLDSIPSSGLDNRGEESSVSKNMLRCSEIAVGLDSEGKGNVEAALEKKSEDVASIHTENAGKTSEAALLSQKVSGVSVESVPAESAMEVTTMEGDGFDDKNDCSPKVDPVGKIDCLEKGKVEVDLDKKSEEIVSDPTEHTGKTSEIVFVPQKVDGNNLEFVPADAALKVTGKQGDELVAMNDWSSTGDFAGQINSLEKSSQSTEGANVKAGSSLEVFEGPGSSNNSVHVLVVPDDLPLREHSEAMLEGYKDHKSEKLPSAVTLGLDQEVEFVEHGKDCVTMPLAEPSESPNKNSKDILHEEDNFSEDVSLGRKMEKTETDADISGPSSAVGHPCKDGNEAEKGKMVTFTEKQNPLVFADTNLQDVLDDSDNYTHSIRGVKPVHDDLGHDNKDAKISDALEAGDTKVAGEELSPTSERFYMSENYITSEKNLLGDRGDCDVRSREAKENVSESAPSVPQSGNPLDDKAETARNYELASEAAASESSNASLLKFDSQTKKLQDSEAAVKFLDSSSEQIIGGECSSAVGASASAISSINDNVDMTEQTHNDKNCAHKDSELIDVSLFNNVKDNDPRLSNIEVSEGVKEAYSFGQEKSGEEGIGKVDLGLISDNDDSIDLTQNTANGSNAGSHGQAASAAEDCFTKEIGGRASAFIDGDRKQEEAVPELDNQADSGSQTDSLEGNWGSVSVLSAFSDALAATDTGSQPSQASVTVEKASLQQKSNNGKSEILNPPSFMTLVENKTDGSGKNEGAPEAQPSEKPQEQAGWFPSVTSGVSESPGRKKNEEVIAKVTNWSTGKQHMPLKSYLGESSPNPKDNPPPRSQGTEKIMMDAKEPVNEAAVGEMRKEWSSPARYPANIKREKGKVRSRPYWAPFICCSSVQTS